MRKIRLITTDELRLLNQILKNVYQSRKDRFFYVYEVVTLNDGGMGSFCFIIIMVLTQANWKIKYMLLVRLNFLI